MNQQDKALGKITIVEDEHGSDTNEIGRAHV